tara:strand:- start:537 stop:764 length:228 start_codon:yes stop_codon:yes gene_type:complete
MIEMFKIMLTKHRAKLAELNLSLQLGEIRDGSGMFTNIDKIIADICHTELYINKYQSILDAYEANKTKEGEKDVE